MNQFALGLTVLAVVFGGATAGMVIRSHIPERHLSEETRSVVSLAMAIVGTLSALVLGLLLSSAQSSFANRDREVTLISVDLTRMDRLLRRYGPETEASRAALRRLARTKLNDVFPDSKVSGVHLDNPHTILMLEELENEILALKPTNNTQQWLQSQVLEEAGQVATTHWSLVNEDAYSTPTPFLIAMTFWLTIVFTSFGLFAPRNPITIVALFCCSLAVSSAIELTLEMQRPFEGLVRISSAPMRRAVDQMEH